MPSTAAGANANLLLQTNIWICILYIVSLTIWLYFLVSLNISIHMCIVHTYVTACIVSAFIRPAKPAAHLLLALSFCPYAVTQRHINGWRTTAVDSFTALCMCMYVVCNSVCSPLYLPCRATASCLTRQLFGQPCVHCSWILSISTTVNN